MKDENSTIDLSQSKILLQKKALNSYPASEISDEVSNEGSDVSELYLRNIREHAGHFKYSAFENSPFEELGKWASFFSSDIAFQYSH